MANDDTVRVVAPDGRTGTIPRANLEKAVARGYKQADVSPWERVSKGFKEYVTEPVKQVGTEAYERGQRTSPGGGVGAAAFELPGTIIDAISGMQAEQMGRSAEATKSFEKKPGLETGMKAASEAAYSIPGVGPVMRDFVTTEDPFEMIGKAAGIITGEKLPGVASETARGVSRGAHGAAQELLLPGAHEVSEARAAHETDQAKQLADHAAKVEEINQQNLQDLAVARSEHQKNLSSLDSEYEKRVAEVGKKTSEDESAYKAKVEQAKDSYARKVADANRKKIEASRQQTGAELKKDTFASKVKSGPAYQRLTGMADQVAQSVEKLDKTVREAYNARWGAWRQAMGDATGNFETVQQAVVNAEDNILKGSPEKIAIFQNMLKEGQDPLLAQASVFRNPGRGTDVKELLSSMKSEGERNRFLRSLRDEGVSLEENPMAKEGATLPIDEIQGYSTELGNKIYRGSLAGDVRRALKSVKDAADAEVNRVADSKGQGKLYRQLRDDWAQYMGDFYDSDGALQKLKGAVNSDRRVALLTGGEGNRIVSSLGRYARFNPDVEAVGRVRSLVKQLSDLPSTSPKPPAAVEAPKFPERPAARALPERPTGPESVAIRPKETPAQPVTSPFNPQEFQKQQFRKVVDKYRRFGWDDKGAITAGIVELLTGRPPYAMAYPALKRAVGRVLGSEKFQRWLIENKPAEIVRTTTILTNPRADQGQKAIARAELEILQGR